MIQSYQNLSRCPIIYSLKKVVVVIVGRRNKKNSNYYCFRKLFNLRHLQHLILCKKKTCIIQYAWSELSDTLTVSLNCHHNIYHVESLFEHFTADEIFTVQTFAVSSQTPCSKCYLQNVLHAFIGAERLNAVARKATNLLQFSINVGISTLNTYINLAKCNFLQIIVRQFFAI